MMEGPSAMGSASASEGPSSSADQAGAEEPNDSLLAEFQQLVRLVGTEAIREAVLPELAGATQACEDVRTRIQAAGLTIAELARRLDQSESVLTAKALRAEIGPLVGAATTVLRTSDALSRLVTTIDATFASAQRADATLAHMANSAKQTAAGVSEVGRSVSEVGAKVATEREAVGRQRVLLDTISARAHAIEDSVGKVLRDATRALRESDVQQASETRLLVSTQAARQATALGDLQARMDTARMLAQRRWTWLTAAWFVTLVMVTILLWRIW